MHTKVRATRWSCGRGTHPFPEAPISVDSDALHLPQCYMECISFSRPRGWKRNNVLCLEMQQLVSSICLSFCVSAPSLHTHEDVHSIEGFQEWHSDKYPYPSCSLCLLPEPHCTTLHHPAPHCTLHHTAPYPSCSLCLLPESFTSKHTRLLPQSFQGHPPQSTRMRCACPWVRCGAYTTCVGLVCVCSD